MEQLIHQSWSQGPTGVGSERLPSREQKYECPWLFWRSTQIVPPATERTANCSSLLVERSSWTLASPCLARTELSWGPTTSDTYFLCHQLASCTRNYRCPFPDGCSVPHWALTGDVTTCHSLGPQLGHTTGPSIHRQEASRPRFLNHYSRRSRMSLKCYGE